VRNKSILFVIAFIALCANAVFAQTSVKAEVDKLKLSTDETLTYKIVITSPERRIPSPQLPKFTGFKVISSAQSQTISFMQGNVKTILVYAFILAPLDVGKFKIEPVQVKIKNQISSSDALEIEVTQGRVKPKILPREKPSLPKSGQPGSREPQITL
jgi:hypothetical protein